MLRQFGVGIDELTTWRQLAERRRVSVAYLKSTVRGQYVLVARMRGWGSPAVIMHKSVLPSVLQCFADGAREVSIYNLYWQVTFVAGNGVYATHVWDEDGEITFKPLLLEATV